MLSREDVAQMREENLSRAVARRRAYHEGMARGVVTDWHEHFGAVVVRLPQDYEPFGEQVRWSDPDKDYPDCSCGCKWFRPLEDEPADWGVCANPTGYRKGLLTFEHQTGEGCFELDETHYYPPSRATQAGDAEPEE